MKYIYSLVISLLFVPIVFAAAPSAPSELSAIAGNGKVYLLWEHSSGLNDVSGYKLYTSTDNGVTFDAGISIVAPSGGLLNNFYIMNNLANGSSYQFKLTAYNASLEQSEAVHSNTVIPADNSQTDNSAPEEIGNLSVIPGDGAVELSWNHSVNTSGDLVGYKVYVSMNNGELYDTGIYMGRNKGYVYTNLANDTTYLFKVTALDSTGNESLGLSISAIPSTELSTVGTGINLGTLPTSTPTFSDVTEGIFKPYIEYLAVRKIINGYSDGTFKPDRFLNRAEAVTLLMRASGLEIDDNISVGTFSDVSENYGLATYIENAYAYSIVSGYSDGTFKPDRQINRGEFIKILVETFTKKLKRVPESYVKFSDVPVDHDFAPWIYAAYKEGITQGYEDKTFKPNDLISRAQAAAMLARYFQGGSSSTIESTIEELQVLSLINTSRVAEGLMPYKINNDISAVSKAHAEDIAKNIKIPSYTGSDGSSPADRLDRSAILYISQSENVAIASYESSSITDTLIFIHNTIMQQADNEQNQKANIFSVYKNFTDIGVGVYVDTANKKIYMVVDFVELDV